MTWRRRARGALLSLASLTLVVAVVGVTLSLLPLRNDLEQEAAQVPIGAGFWVHKGALKGLPPRPAAASCEGRLIVAVQGGFEIWTHQQEAELAFEVFEEAGHIKDIACFGDGSFLVSSNTSLFVQSVGFNRTFLLTDWEEPREVEILVMDNFTSSYIVVGNSQNSSVQVISFPEVNETFFFKIDGTTDFGCSVKVNGEFILVTSGCSETVSNSRETFVFRMELGNFTQVKTNLSILASDEAVGVIENVDEGIAVLAVTEHEDFEIVDLRNQTNISVSADSLVDAYSPWFASAQANSSLLEVGSRDELSLIDVTADLWGIETLRFFERGNVLIVTGPSVGFNGSAIHLFAFQRTESPTISPTVSPSESPSMRPSLSPTQFPTRAPSFSPMTTPSQSPSPKEDKRDIKTGFAGGVAIFCFLAIFFVGWFCLTRRSDRISEVGSLLNKHRNTQSTFSVATNDTRESVTSTNPLYEDIRGKPYFP